MATIASELKAAPFAELSADIAPAYPTPWPALIVTRAEIQAEVERLLELDRGPGQQRASEVVHPSSIDTGHAVTPGLAIAINVLRPGEEIEMFRDNATRVEFILRGEGSVTVGASSLALAKWSVVSHPSMLRRAYRNHGREPLVWLSYSNTALLKRLGNYYSDDRMSVPRPPRSERSEIEQRYVAKNAPDFAILSDGARLRGYEFVTDIEVVENKPLIWPWSETSPHLAAENGDGKRNLLLLVNPATGRRQGTTHSFFAALSRIPGGINRPVPPRGHKHSSFAVNYHFEGAGESIVDGKHYEWEAGDLMLSAPAWGEHAHGMKMTGASVLTVQDHPFHMAIGSLIWQEEMDGPILTLGSEEGQTGYVGPRQIGD
ncbi:hypothetical protein U1839_00630 [Sphingomonas sp. RT2P30]|uniref:hypothetical protein n=1 Tax=Parasphingomonas halimpatiens TaxID=3096162 RepID=UPI002FCB008F